MSDSWQSLAIWHRFKISLWAPLIGLVNVTKYNGDKTMPSVLVESVYSSEEAWFLLILYHVEVKKTVLMWQFHLFIWFLSADRPHKNTLLEVTETELRWVFFSTFTMMYRFRIESSTVYYSMSLFCALIWFLIFITITKELHIFCNLLICVLNAWDEKWIYTQDCSENGR